MIIYKENILFWCIHFFWQFCFYSQLSTLAPQFSLSVNHPSWSLRPSLNNCLLPLNICSLCRFLSHNNSFLAWTIFLTLKILTPSSSPVSCLGLSLIDATYLLLSESWVCLVWVLSFTCIMHVHMHLCFLKSSSIIWLWF